MLDRAYATNVMSRYADSFLREHRDQKKPYFLEVATYGPHAQMTEGLPRQPAVPVGLRRPRAQGPPGGRQLRHEAVRAG